MAKIKPTAILPKNIILPNHLALICDGNRRWARARGLPPFEGHRTSRDILKAFLASCRKFGIHTVTLWVFSTENWDRSKKEIEVIMNLLEQVANEVLQNAGKQGVRVIHLGRKDRIPASLAKTLAYVEQATKNNHKFVLNLAIDYGGHDEILRATKQMLKDEIDPAGVNEQLFNSYLDTGDQLHPYVDLLIRTSGEQRLSGILPWQMAYAEIWWEEAHLPDFTEEKLVEALLDYSRRRRRFGGNDDVYKLNFQPQLVARLELDWWRARQLADRGELTTAFARYVKEQFGTSVSIAKEAATIFLRALIMGETEGDWKGTKRILGRFYALIRDNVKLALEPQLAAGLEMEYLQGSNGKKKLLEMQDTVRALYAEVFRIPLLQAQKVAYLRLLAHEQHQQAATADGREKRDFERRAEEYLIRSYEVLKERLA